MKRFMPSFGANTFVERVKTNSVLNPLLWLCAIVLSMTLGAAHFESDPVLKACLMVLAFVVVLAPVIAYFIWTFREPNRLQSEDYQLAQQKILHGTKEDPIFLPTDNTADLNNLPQLESDDDQPDEVPDAAGSLLLPGSSDGVR